MDNLESDEQNLTILSHMFLYLFLYLFTMLVQIVNINHC